MGGMTAVRRVLFIVSCLGGAVAAHAQDQDLGEIQQAVAAFVRANTHTLPGKVDVAVSPLDPRTRLRSCETFEAFLGPNGRLWGSSSVGVRCLRPSAWTIYVPVTVKVVGTAVVTRRPIARGQTLSAVDLRTQTVDLTQLPAGMLTDPQQAIGKAAVAAYPEGFALRTEMLRAPYAVMAGQPVRVVVQGDGFEVSSDGRALGNAAIGETVQVRSSSGKMLTGVVLEAGIVEVR